jgi:predicted metal-binding membrane protein
MNTTDMDRLQKILLIALISTSASAWIGSQIFQAEMMNSMMMPFSALSASVFVVVWTVGMAAMMLPAISPIILLYNRLLKNTVGNATPVVEGSRYSIRMILFVGCYLAVWSMTGLSLFLGWSLLLSNAIAATGLSGAIYGFILVVAGAYQFSSVKRKCLGYCESPMGFFMRRWRKGTAGAVTMGTYHGLYCLGCCWPYFLLMVALGWMDIMWMALFAGIIFVEKIWSHGIWIARTVGIGFAIAGVIFALGIVDISVGHRGMLEQEMPAVQEPAENQILSDSMSDMKM